MTSPADFPDRLAAATTAHDLDALVDCFTDDYELTQPAHPSRSFTGSDQVRANWQQIFAAVPDLRATVTARAVDGSNGLVRVGHRRASARRHGPPDARRHGLRAEG